MLKNEDIICISSIDWDFIWQGHQEIMTRFARNGNRVLFIDNTGVRVPGIHDIGRIKSRIANWRKGIHGIRKIEDGLYVYSPLVLPFPYLKIARFINKKLIFSILFKWLKMVGFSEPVVWVFLPTGLSLDLINEIEHKILIYYCIDSFQASSKDARKIKITEKSILKKADIVFVTSVELLKYCSQYNKRVHYFPFGVNITNFRNVLQESGTIPEDIRKVKKPIAGYIGGIHKWIDFDLLHYVASKNEDISFVFCGPIQTDTTKIKHLPNIIFLGQKSQEELPRYVKEFDVAIIPYKITEYTKNVYPTKLNEYLSMGKYAISTDLPEIRKFNRENNNIVRIVDTKDVFANKVREAVNQPLKERDVAFAMQVAEKNSWLNKIKQMSSLIEDIENEKVRQREKLWKGNLTRLYKETRRRFVPVITTLALIYALFFYTPFIWFLASPLRIVEKPEKANVIVVLGGGVGETGSPGKSTIERARYSAELYREGFSEYIIYSSGFTYKYNDAENMKLFAISMGVPEKNIILEQQAGSTYENVKYTYEILQRRGFYKILLVSSPYNMRRASLVFKHIAKAIDVVYTPVLEPEFYLRERRVKLDQIRAIVHEYLGIIYYFIKGYI